MLGTPVFYPFVKQDSSHSMGNLQFSVQLVSCEGATVNFLLAFFVLSCFILYPVLIHD